MNKIERQYELAKEVMIKLGIKKCHIEKMTKCRSVYVFEDFGAVNINNYPTLQDKKRFLEEKYKIFIYAVTHNIINAVDNYSFLYIPHNLDDLNNLIDLDKNKAIVNAFTIDYNNSSNDGFNSVVLEQKNGGIQICLQ